MTDIVERLESLGDHASFEPSAYHDAAAEIKALRARVKALETPSESANRAAFSIIGIKFSDLASLYQDGLTLSPNKLLGVIAAVERYARAEALKPYAGMRAVPAPVWDNSQCKMGDIFIGFIRVEGLGFRCYSSTARSENWCSSVHAAREWVEQQAIARLGAVVIGKEE